MERSIAFIHTFCIFAQLILHTVQFFLVDTWGLLNDLHLHLSRYKGDTVSWHILEVTAYIGRCHSDIFHQFLAHLLYHLTVFQILTQVITNLRKRLMLIFLQALTRSVDHFEPVADLLLYFHGHIGIGYLNTVYLGLMLEKLLNGDLLRDGTVGITLPFHTFHCTLHTHGLNVRFEDGIVADNPYYLIDHGSHLYGILVLGRSSKRQHEEHGTY